MKQFLVKQRSDITLRRKDLRDQLSKLPFWVEKNDAGKPLYKRFGPGAASSLAWGFDLDKMPELGYRPCTDEEWEDYMGNPDAGDPRKGPFYFIVNLIVENERKQRQAAR